MQIGYDMVGDSCSLAMKKKAMAEEKKTPLRTDGRTIWGGTEGDDLLEEEVDSEGNRKVLGDGVDEKHEDRDDEDSGEEGEMEGDRGGDGERDWVHVGALLESAGFSVRDMGFKRSEESLEWS